MHLRLERAAPERAGPDVDELIRRAQCGDDAAFEQLYRQHVGRVYALCLRLAGNAARAEEMTQDVFVRAWAKLDAFRGESAFGSWLHRIAVNVALAAFRADDRRGAAVRTMAESFEGIGVARLPIPGADIDLERAVASLPPGARTVFVLHDIEGYQHEEIAKLTGTAVGTCKAQLHRARRLLREALG